MPTVYAIARQLDPATGDVVLLGSTWANGSPLTEIVVRVLRTAKGTYLPDQAFGLDLSALNKASPNAPAVLEKAIRNALAFLVRQGLLTNLQVTVERQGTALAFQVAFTDPRNQSKDAVRDKV